MVGIRAECDGPNLCNHERVRAGDLFLGAGLIGTVAARVLVAAAAAVPSRGQLCCSSRTKVVIYFGKYTTADGHNIRTYGWHQRIRFSERP